MNQYIISIVILENLFALKPLIPPLNDSMNTTAPLTMPCSNSPVVTFDRDTLTEAFVNNPTNRDFQICRVTPFRIWAVKEINGTYAHMLYQFPDGRREVTNFFDWATNTWVADTDGYDTTGLRLGGYGAWTVNYSSVNGYQYHFFVTFHSDNYGYQADVQWPDTPFDPLNPSPNYTTLEEQDTNQTWPCIGITQNGYLHQIFCDYDGHMSGIQYATIYTRSQDLLSGMAMLQ